MHPDILADIREWNYHGPGRVDLVWASPPCTEFAKFGMKCFYPSPPLPDKSIWEACRRIINDVNPRYYVIENVKGAIKFMGPPQQIIKPFYLWTNLPSLPHMRFKDKQPKEWTTVKDGFNTAMCRAMIPRELSMAVAVLVAGQTTLL